ncbi:MULTISPECIES: aminoacyl-tRNA hydrolase [unclassified Haematospirillum]|uniref:aminoacyl-tRNA hydrolase n=1 Tax=unclassified Haematospirillum TaxID=2622088 RepID=UPI00143BF3ED|nr:MULTISPECIES: aminoacyl-tRNA hydrolase [unclassified Haematospirillum]NKD55332.1 aminoacyl-tRNA hydrolase [Haematospirillum sp. H4890]NKD75551.1 aminoacyl-tRNA hydrolase [Haematospirillum sp. H4485]NKD88365.1 aminoacyl-tRNA hydrolase [Haematospirillum sp. 15-248]
MWLVVGLGNPGAEYAGNRHNVGFMAADALVRRHSFSSWRSKHHGELADGSIAGQRVMVLKPMTFMNRSGLCVGEVARFYKIPLSNILVLHDELELSPGRLRIKQGGGHAGHNGLRDIDAHLGHAYWRVRLGIGRPHDKALVNKWVLGDFAKSDSVWLAPFLDAVSLHFHLILDGDHAGFMNRVTTATQPPRPKKEKPAAVSGGEATQDTDKGSA